MKRAYEFGQDLRRSKYSNFLNENYNRENVYVRSTDYDRTLVTVSSILAGLYPPNGEQKWNNEIGSKWQPIPIHTNDIKLDNIFYQKECPKVKDLFEQVKQTDEFKSYLNQNKDFINDLNVAIVNGNVTIYDLEHIADGIFIEKENNMNLPKWAQDNYEKIIELGSYIYHFYYLTNEQARLVAGGILNQLRVNIQTKTTNYSSVKSQLSLYSSHDTYVAALVKLLNLTEHIRQPPYLAAIILELHKSSNNQDSKYFVKCLYKNSTINEKIKYKTMRIGKCSAVLCPLEEFLMITQNLVITDYQTECKSSSSALKFIKKEFKKSFLFYFSICFTFFFSIVFSVAAILNFYSARKMLHTKFQSQTRQYETVNLIIGDFNEDDDDEEEEIINMNSKK
jgi:hypothetical protein